MYPCPVIKWLKWADKRGSEVEAVNAAARQSRGSWEVLERSQRPTGAESLGNRNGFVYCCCLTVCHARDKRNIQQPKLITASVLRRVRHFIPRLLCATSLFFPSLSPKVTCTALELCWPLCWPITQMPLRSAVLITFTKTVVLIMFSYCCFFSN